jgi:hypothetical protein
MHASQTIVLIVPEAVTPKWADQTKPRYPTHPPRTNPPPGMPQQAIPQAQRQALLEAGKRLLAEHRASRPTP